MFFLLTQIGGHLTKGLIQLIVEETCDEAHLEQGGPPDCFTVKYKSVHELLPY